MHDKTTRQAFPMQRSLYDASSQQYYDGLDDVDEALDVFPAIHSMSLAASPTRPSRHATSPLKTQLEWQLSNTSTATSGITATTATTHSLLAGHHLYRYPSSSSAATSTSCFLQQDNDNDDTDTTTTATNAGSPLPSQRLQQTQLGLPAVICCSTSAFLTQKQRAAGSTTATSPVAAAAAGLASAPSLLRAYSHTGISSTTNSPASRLSSMFSGSTSSRSSAGGAQQASAVHRSPSYQGSYGFELSSQIQQHHSSSATLDSSNSNDSGNMNGPFYIGPSSSNMKVSDSFGPTAASAGPPSPGNSMLPPAPHQYRTIHSGSSYQQQQQQQSPYRGDVSMASIEQKPNPSVGHARHSSYSQAVNSTPSSAYTNPPRRSMEGLTSAYPQSQQAQQQRFQQDLVNSANNSFPYPNVYDPAAMANNALNSSSAAAYANMPPLAMLPNSASSSSYPKKAQDTYEPVNIHSKSAMTKGSSTTSEFTKRKNWSQRIVEEMQDVLHVLSPDGVFLFASPSLLDLTGWSPEEVLGRSIKDFMDRDDIDPFIYEFERSMKTESPMTIYYRFISKDEKPVLFEVTGRPYYSSPQDASSGIVPDDIRFANGDVNMGGAANRTSRVIDEDGLDMDFTESPQRSPRRQAEQLTTSQPPPLANPNAVSPERGPCKAFFAMARPYPGKAGAMLDSFLELKMENEKLRQKLAEVYREIEGDTSLPSTYTGDGGSLSGSYESSMMLDSARPSIGDRQISGFPSRHYGTGNAMQFDGTNASEQYGSSLGGISTYLSQLSTSNPEQSTLEPNAARSRKTEAIDKREVLVSSSTMIPARGDTYGVLGIGVVAKPDRNAANTATASGTAPANAEGGEGDDKKKKPKKQRTEEGDFVCRDCGSTDSPEWRRGPHGPKTLCNACGLRWAKKNKIARQSISETPAAAAAA